MLVGLTGFSPRVAAIDQMLLNVDNVDVENMGRTNTLEHLLTAYLGRQRHPSQKR